MVDRSRRRSRREQLAPAEQLRLMGLSQREAAVTLFVAHGLLVREIADQLEVAPGTVKTLLARARRKLECRNLRDLVVVLLEDGVLTADELLARQESLSDNTRSAHIRQPEPRLGVS